MKISSIANYRLNNVNFKGLCLYTGIYTPEPDEFVKSNGSIDITRLKELKIPNFRLIDSTSVRGATLAHSKPEFLGELKESGIRTVIDLRKEGGCETNYAKNCKNNGLDYFKIVMPVLTDKKDVQNFLSKLPDFLDIMSSGKNYMSCFLGLHRTDIATSLNYLINQKEPSFPPVLSHIFIDNEKNYTEKYINFVKNILKLINKTDFIENFRSRIMKLRSVNGLK